MEVDWHSIFKFLTDFSTIAMAFFAGLALNTWKKELKLQK